MYNKLPMRQTKGRPAHSLLPVQVPLALAPKVHLGPARAAEELHAVLALEDGDDVIMRGFGEKLGYPRVGFGECRGIVLAAKG